MTKTMRRRILLIAAATILVAAVIYAFLPDPIAVDTATVTRGPLQVIVEEEGETRIRDRYTVAAPVAAFANRIDVEVGDLVEQGEPIVRLEPPRAAILDPRAQAQAEARLRTASAALEDAAVTLQRANTDRDRLEVVFDAGGISQQEVEQARAAAVTAAAAFDAARAEVDAAQAALRGAAAGASPPPSVVRAPAGGRVLAVHRRSEGPVAPGEPLVEIGDTRQIEVESDVLSQDAVRIPAGARVIIDQWGGDTPLEAVVTRVEPEGFTKVSALGVEEQRVPVRARLTSPPAQWAGLGTGYRVLARFIIWEGANVLQVPTSALFRSSQDEWAVFVVGDGRAVRRIVQIGRQAGLATQIAAGLEAGEEVVIHPPAALEDGSRVGDRD